MKKDNNENAATFILLVLLAEECGAEINITPNGISLWTTDATDFQCQDISPKKVLKALKALKRFRNFWSLP